MHDGVFTPDLKKPSDHRSDQTGKKKVSVVYFLRVENGEYLSVDIGTTTDFAKRLQQHRKSGKGPRSKIDPICVVRGNADDEKAVHRFFESCRVPDTREEFWPKPELVDYIRWLRDNHFVWVPDDQCAGTVEQLELVGPEFWMPRPGTERRKAEPCPLLSSSHPLMFEPRVVTIDDFYTNAGIIAAARETLGGIDLDPASHPVANRVVQAHRIYTRHENGLEQSWSGRVWLNPPFSEWADWVPKICAELAAGRIESMCVLCACRTLTAQYFRPVKDKSSGICILDGRIPFWGGKAGDSPDDGHVVFYFGKHPEKFQKAFSVIGTVWRAA